MSETQLLLQMLTFLWVKYSPEFVPLPPKKNVVIFVKSLIFCGKIWIPKIFTPGGNLEETRNDRDIYRYANRRVVNFEREY